MKKHFLLVIAVLSLFATYGQRTVTNSTKNTLDVPAVTIQMSNITETTYTGTFTKNAECAYFYILTMSTSDIAMWTQMMGMTVEQLIVQWGILSQNDTTYTWTDQTPDVEYNVFALPFGSDDVEAPYAVSTFTTSNLGGEGLSVIDVAVSNITATSALTVCTPNDQTARFYDGMITVEYFNEIGQDSLVSMFSQQEAYYSTDTWEWLSLIPSTDYYMVAFGYNANNELGDVTLFPFTTPDAAAISENTTANFSIYPIPCDGTFHVDGDVDGDYTLRIFSLDGKCVYQQSLTDCSTAINSFLAAGSYCIQIADGAQKMVYTGKMIVK